MTAPAIVFRDVAKRYGEVQAVDRVSLAVRPGEVYALLGLNGAGKTTLIRMLLGMVRPSSGSVEVLGRPVGERGVWSRVGYLVESPAAYPELTVRENLDLARRLRHLSGPAAVRDVIELFGLGPYAERRARTLSLGNAQRLALAKALLHRPELLVLDEPVNGLDPAGVVEVRDLLAGLAREHGTTVFMSSHILGEVSRLATRIGVLHEGLLVDEFEAADLAQRVVSRLEVRTRDNARATRALADAGIGAELVEDDLVLDEPWAALHPDAVASALVRGGTPPVHLAVAEEDLESYFLRLVGRAAPGPVIGTAVLPDAR